MTHHRFELAGTTTIDRMGFGAMRITGRGIWGEPKDRAEAGRVLERALALGVNFIDTADSYGPEVSERIIAETLHPYPDDLVIATKGGLTRSGPGRWHPDCRPEHLREACEGSLNRLGVDRIDLYQLHTVDRKVPYEESIGALKDLQDEGKVRWIGLSNVGRRELDLARTIVDVVSVQNRYSLTDRSSEGVLEACERANLAFIPWGPVGSGNLARPGGVLDRIASERRATPAQIGLAWLLHRSPVMIPIPGTSSVAHLEENVAARDLELTADDVKTIEDAVA